MQLYIYFSIALVALSSAKQLKIGSQILFEDSSSSKQLQKNGKRSVTQEFNLYFKPEKLQALQTVKLSQNPASIETLKQNSGVSEEFYNELIQKYYAENLKPAPIEEPQEEPVHSLPNFFLPREEYVYNNKPTYRQLLMDQTKLSGQAHNVRKNKYNQIASPIVTDAPFYNLASGVNRNEDQRTSEKEIEYFLRNLQIDQPRQFNSPTQVRIQNNGRNVGLKKSAVEKEIENAWRKHQAFEFERSNPPADISKQSFSLSASDENSENTEGWEQIKYILRNGQVYGFERLNAPTEVNNRGFQGRKELHNKTEVEKEMEKFWRKQQTFQIPKSIFKSENNDKSEIDQHIKNIFIPQLFVYERLNSPAEVSKQSLSASNETQKMTENHKQIQYFLSNGQVYGFERTNAPDEFNNQGSRGENKLQKNSEVEREIEMFWRNQQDPQFQGSIFPVEILSQDLSGGNENKVKSKVEKTNENIFRPQRFGYERSYSPSDVTSQSPSGKKENEDNTETENLIKFILRNLKSDDESGDERQNAPEVYNDSLFLTNTDENKSDVEKEIQNILKKHQDFEFQIPKSAAIALRQSFPFKIQERVPEPVPKTEQVSVPTRVLVPFPQPYPIKVTHLYPVPLKVVNQY